MRDTLYASSQTHTGTPQAGRLSCSESSVKDPGDRPEKGQTGQAQTPLCLVLFTDLFSPVSSSSCLEQG